MTARDEVNPNPQEYIDPLIDVFLELGYDKLLIKVEGISSNHLKDKFYKRINERKLDQKIRIVIFDDSIYLTNPNVLFRIPEYTP